MSINFRIVAVKYKILPKSKKNKKPVKIENHYIYFDTLQTPSVDTEIIMSNKKPIKAYKEWVRININYPKDHLTALKCFIKQSKQNGYEIQCEAW